MFPTECRERGITYRAKMTAILGYRINSGPAVTEARSIGHLPIMIKSVRCHLRDLSSAQLIAKKEDGDELGGYFIVNGIEKLVRLLIVTRRNHPMALIRSSFCK